MSVTHRTHLCYAPEGTAKYTELLRTLLPRTTVNNAKRRAEAATPRLEDSVLLLITFGGLLSSHPRSSQGRFRLSLSSAAREVLAW